METKLTEQELIEKLLAIAEAKLTAINQSLQEINSKVSTFNDCVSKITEGLTKINRAWADMGGEVSGVSNADLTSANIKVSEYRLAIIQLNDLVLDKNAELGTMLKNLTEAKAGLKKVQAVSVKQVEDLTQQVATKLAELTTKGTEIDALLKGLSEKLKIKEEAEPEKPETPKPTE